MVWENVDIQPFLAQAETEENKTINAACLFEN